MKLVEKSNDIFCNCCRRQVTFASFLLIFILSSEAAKQRVCIVGAGISGLVTAKYFNEYPNEFKTVVFEKNSNVGGQWIYTNSTTIDEHGLPVHSSIYKSLRTIAVKEMMTFPDYPRFGSDADKGKYVKHEVVLEYLRNYTDHFNLRRFIMFNTNVEKVRPWSRLRWLIFTKNLNTKKRSKWLCDAVVICNGHDVKGYIPEIKGIESFTGRVMHSHVYRRAKLFANQTVVLLGASYSGIDISIDVSSTAKKVYLSHRHDKITSKFPPNLEQVPGAVAADGNELILSNGTRIKADALMFCKGYVYDFPFLQKDSGIVVEKGKYIKSIYKHLINIERPTMAIVNVLTPGLHFQIPHAQANYFRAVLRGKLKLPSRKQMLIVSQLPVNISTSQAHISPFNTTFRYFDELELAVGGKPLPWWFTPVGDQMEKLIKNDPAHYRDKKLVIHEDERRVEFV